MEKLDNNQRFKHELKLLGTFTLISVFIYVLRVILSGELKYLFLVWNLFLATVPWMVSNFYISYYNRKFRIILIAPLLFLWILFLPNSPYILTDIFHIVHSSRMPIWYDLFLILSFAWTALVFGFTSLRHFEQIIRKKFTMLTSLIINSSIIFLISYGVYLGRFLRWNSWDVFHSPGTIIHDILWNIFHPLQSKDAIGITLLLGVFLNMVYHTVNYREYYLHLSDRNDHLIKT